MLGDSAYTAVLWLNRYFNIMRRRLGYQYWSLSAYLKHRVKNAMQYIGSFADAVATEATRRGVDGVACGHIHWIEHWMPDPLRRHIDDEPEIEVQAQLPEQFLSQVVPVHRPSGNHFYAERARYAGLVSRRSIACFMRSRFLQLRRRLLHFLHPPIPPAA